MKILCLYNNSCALPLFDWLRDEGHKCILWREKLESNWVEKQKFDLGVSYTYSRIIKKDIISILKGNIVNLHTSYLPWNRGVDPNMWSLIDNTPRGVTLHYIDERLDKGEIIAQEIVPLLQNDTATLKSTYDDLDYAAIKLFKNAFAYYQYWNDMKKQVSGKGTYHTDKQGEELRKYITTFDMKVKDFLERLQRRGSIL